MTRVTGGSLPRIAVGTSTMVGRRYTRGAPPLVGMRIATPAVRAAPAAARLTACLAGGCDGDAAGAPGPQPPRAAALGGRGGGRQMSRPASKAAPGEREKGIRTGECGRWANNAAPQGWVVGRG